jgi:hypothetical protein
MQYSLTSTNGTNGTWFDCTNVNTNVAFIAGKVYVRAKAQPANYREVAVLAPAAAAPDVSGVAYNVAAGVITGTAGNMQYRIAGGQWNNASTTGITSGVAFDAGSLEFRIRPTISALASAIAVKAVILPADDAPVLASNDVANTISGMSAAYEYKISPGEWTSGDIAGDFSGAVEVQVRRKATAADLSSLAQTVVFTRNLDMSGADINVAAGTITGTAASMQYSLTSTNGADGTWFNCTDIYTNVVFAPARVYVRAKDQPANLRLVAVVAAAAAAPDIIGVDYDIAAGIITGTAINMQYRIGTGSWKDTATGGTTFAVPFTEGSLEFRTRPALTALASQPAVKAVIAAPEAAPSLVFNDAANTIDGLDATYEYRIEGPGEWTSGDIPGDFSGEVTVHVRRKATQATLPGEIQVMVFSNP